MDAEQTRQMFMKMVQMTEAATRLKLHPPSAPALNDTHTCKAENSICSCQCDIAAQVARHGGGVIFLWWENASCGKSPLVGAGLSKEKTAHEQTANGLTRCFFQGLSRAHRSPLANLFTFVKSGHPACPFITQKQLALRASPRFWQYGLLAFIATLPLTINTDTRAQDEEIADRAFCAAPLLRHVEVAMGIQHVGIAASTECTFRQRSRFVGVVHVKVMVVSVRQLSNACFPGCAPGARTFLSSVS